MTRFLLFLLLCIVVILILRAMQASRPAGDESHPRRRWSPRRRPPAARPEEIVDVRFKEFTPEPPPSETPSASEGKTPGKEDEP